MHITYDFTTICLIALCMAQLSDYELVNYFYDLQMNEDHTFENKCRSKEWFGFRSNSYICTGRSFIHSEYTYYCLLLILISMCVLKLSVHDLS